MWLLLTTANGINKRTSLQRCFNLETTHAYGPIGKIRGQDDNEREGYEVPEARRQPDNQAKGYEIPILRGGGCPDKWSVRLDVI